MSRPARLRRVALAAVLAVGLAGCERGPGAEPENGGPPPAEPRRVAIEVAYGEPVEHALAGGECHLLEVELGADRFVELTIEQRGIDVVTTLTPPDGAEPLVFDSPTHEWAIEGGAYVSGRGGLHRIEICPFRSGGEGRYRIHVSSPRPPNDADRASALGFRRYSQGVQYEEAGDSERAVPELEAALSSFRAAAAVRPQAWAHFLLGRLENARDRAVASERHYSAAADLFHELGDRKQEASALSYVGNRRTEWGDLEGAREAHRRSVAAAEEGGDREQVLVTLANLALIEEQLGATLEALELHRKRRRLAAEAGDAESEVDALIRMGKVYRTAGDDVRAQRIFEEALGFARDRRLEEAVTQVLTDLGRVSLDREDAEAALPYFLQALEREESSGPSRTRAEILNNVGRCYRRLGERAKAIDSFRRALAAIPEGDWDEEILEGLVLINLAALHNLEGDPDAAYEPSLRALDLLREAGRPIYTTGALKCLADVAVARGDLEGAAAYLAEVTEIVETLRGRSALRDLRASFLEDSYAYYEAYVDVLLRLDEREPGSGYARRAFEIAERAKARILLDNLTAAGAPPEPGVESEPVRRRHEIERRMSELDRLLLQTRAEKGDDDVIRSLERRLRDLESEHALTTARIFTENPEWSALLDAEPASLEEIRRVLLAGGDTQLVSFLLGEDRSFAWIVGRETFQVEALPPRETLDRLARQAARHLERSDQPHLALQADLAARELSSALLGPVVPHLTARRVLLVRDGALHYVPFAALPVPAGEPDLLTDRFELADVPSASAGVALRRRSAGTPEAFDSDLAIFADPVFEADDERLASGPSLRGASPPDAPVAGDDLPRTTRSLGLGGLGRLAGSLEEARRISRLVPEDRRLLALGFDARRDLLLSGRLRRFRLLHLAGHGLAHPDLTGLVLSLYDSSGRRIDGLVRPHEIYGMKLSAELVVLSACSTGRGDEVRGEGLLGLSRGFLHAGASKVLASLWDVDDRATAALMERFYVALLEGGEPPGQALRTAQLAVRRDPRWRAPHYWAGFVLQGDGF